MINKSFADFAIQTSLKEGMPIQLSRLIACQSAHETGNFTSHAFIKNHNGFGYKYYKGSAYQIGAGIISTEKDPYAAYATYEDSIGELCSWIKRRQKEFKFPADLTKIQTGEQYAHLLKECGYYGGKEVDYANDINNFLKQLTEWDLA